MYHKLDLVRVHINQKRHTLSKWLSVSFSDLILLSGQEIGHHGNYEIMYRKPGLKALITFNEDDEGEEYIWPEQGMEIFVRELNR